MFLKVPRISRKFQNFTIFLNKYFQFYSIFVEYSRAFYNVRNEFEMFLEMFQKASERSKKF